MVVAVGTSLEERFGVDKPVVAMAHLPPLPGTPLYDEVGGRGRSSSPWRPVTGPSASTTGAMRTQLRPSRRSRAPRSFARFSRGRRAGDALHGRGARNERGPARLER